MRSGKKILYLSYEGMTDALGQSQVLSYMEKLAAEFEVAIISFEKKDRFLTLGKEIEEKCKRAGIAWYPLSYTKTPPVVSTVYDVWKMRRKANSLYKQKKFDIVHCRSYITSLVGLELKKKFGVKFIFDMRGFWIDEKIEAGYWKKGSPVYASVINYLRKKESLFYTHADVIVSLTKAAKDVILSMRPDCAGKVFVIPTCVNLQVFGPFNAAARQEVRAEMNIPADAFVLLYSGGYGANYNIGFLKEVFAEIKKEWPESYILVLSKDGITGLENDEIKKDVRAISLPYSKVGRYLMAGDLGVINYTHHFSVSARSPTKLAEYWACGLPAVAPPGIGDVDYLFTHYKKGGILYGQDFIARLKEIVQSDKTTLRSYAEDYFSLESGVAKYRGLYHFILPAPGSPAA